MSKFDLDIDMTTPFTPRTKNKLLGHINRMTSLQEVAATLAGDPMTNGQASENWFIGDLYLLVGTGPAAGEDMTFDVQVDGVSILTGLFTLDDTVAIGDQISLLDLVTDAGQEIPLGALVTVDRVYTAGGGPAPILNTTVVLEPAHGPYQE